MIKRQSVCLVCVFWFGNEHVCVCAGMCAYSNMSEFRNKGFKISYEGVCVCLCLYKALGDK